MSETNRDDEPQYVEYESSTNISFRGVLDTGYTKGEWKKLSTGQQDDEMTNLVMNELVEIYPSDIANEDEWSPW